MQVVHDSAFRGSVTGMLDIIEDPPGQEPPTWLIELHDWFAALDPSDRAMVTRVAELVADDAVFGVLCLLDNVRPVVDGYTEELRLNVEGPDGERPMREDSVELHGLFRDLVEPR